ncbi:hypothetical protein BGW38_001665, partial [Lunasporangiospora selenospora]
IPSPPEALTRQPSLATLHATTTNCSYLSYPELDPDLDLDYNHGHYRSRGPQQPRFACGLGDLLANRFKRSRTRSCPADTKHGNISFPTSHGGSVIGVNGSMSSRIGFSRTSTCTSSMVNGHVGHRSPGLHLTPTDTRASFSSTRPNKNRLSLNIRPSVNGLDHGLKLNFLSTLGPGIPVTPTASVFGDDMSGFIRRDPSNPGGLFGYSPEEEKQVVRKIDWRIIPILGMFYAASTLSRINLTNARMFAFEVSLHGTPDQFTRAIAMFFVGFGLAEVPSIMILFYLSPKVWLPLSMFAWSCLNFMMAWTKTFPLLLTCRFFLGIAEAALIPGVLLYISTFYKRSEQAFRLALLTTFSSAAGAFGGLISGAIGYMDGRFNLHGWQWIFVIESLPAIAFSIASWFLLTNSPESAPWLDQRQTSIAIYRVRNDTKVKVTRTISKQHVLAALKDFKVYVFMAINIAVSIPIISSIGVFTRAWMEIARWTQDGEASFLTPNSTASGDIQGQAGISGHPIGDYIGPDHVSLLQNPTSSARVLAQMLSAPTYIAGAISTICVATLADRTQQRGLILIALAIVSITGYCLVLASDNVYAASMMYNSRDAPRYLSGHVINISMLVTLILLAILQRTLFRRENKRRDFSISFGVNPLKYFSKAELRDLNDKHPAFRYTL